MDEVTEPFGLSVALTLPHVQKWFDGALNIFILDSVLPSPCSAAILVWRSAQPNLVGISSHSNESHFCHVRASATVGTSSHAHDKGLSRQSHLLHEVVDPIDVLRHHSLGFRLSKSAKGKCRARNALTSHVVNLLNGFDSMLLENSINLGFFLLLNSTNLDVLMRGQSDVTPVGVNNLAKSSLELEASLILDTALFNIHAQEPLAIALRMPSKPIDHLPFWKRDPWLNLLAKV
mmetsp:Transcript_1024/g.3206  ORF Transcript_1024/g.3206 Transcript_1024/m.3206 type:complete len:233 (-) Transcript_1024:1373-2071(-)